MLGVLGLFKKGTKQGTKQEYSLYSCEPTVAVRGYS